MKVFQKSNRLFVIVFLVLLVTFLVPVNSSEKSKIEQEVFQGAQYVMAQPGSVNIVQRDKSQLTITKTGDEVIHYVRTTDGYTLLPDDVEIYYYAKLKKNKDMVISSYKANNPGKRSKKEEQFLKKVQKHLKYSEKQKKEKKDKWKSGSGSKGLSKVQFGPIGDTFPSTGNRNMLVILGQFSDWTFVKTNNDFNSLMNVGSGSFKAYYQDNSYGALNVTTTVVGPYTIDMTMSAADSNYRSYVAQLVDAANNDGVDFSQYDNNNDGNMDALYVIHAGYGEEYTGAPIYYIWSHSSDLASYARNYDGVNISSYATSPELRNLSGNTISAIGVICHEFGHNMGVPDYYDTSSGGSAWDLKSWDVMARGSWNNNGDTPAQHCMFTKWKMGWSNPTVISIAATLTLNNTADNNEAYRINTTTKNEFFILENRQKSGWDTYIPGHGLLIFHIDGNFIDGLSTNTVNANPSHQGVDIEEADNVRSTDTYDADPFPGADNKTSFTDTTTPSAKSWADTNTGKPVTNISEGSGTITFDFMGGAPLTVDYITISGTSTIFELMAALYSATAYMSDGTTQDVTSSCTWTENTSYGYGVVEDNDYIFYSTSVPYDISFQITARYGSKTATKNVTILDFW